VSTPVNGGMTGERKRVLPHNGTVNVGRLGLRWCHSALSEEREWGRR